MHPTQVCLYNEELIVKCTGIMAVSFILPNGTIVALKYSSSNL